MAATPRKRLPGPCTGTCRLEPRLPPWTGFGGAAGEPRPGGAAHAAGGECPDPSRGPSVAPRTDAPPPAPSLGTPAFTPHEGLLHPLTSSAAAQKHPGAWRAQTLGCEPRGRRHKRSQGRSEVGTERAEHTTHAAEARDTHAGPRAHTGVRTGTRSNTPADNAHRICTVAAGTSKRDCGWLWGRKWDLAGHVEAAGGVRKDTSRPCR